MKKKIIKTLKYKGKTIEIKEDEHGCYAYVNGKHIGCAGFGWTHEAVQAAKDYVG